MEYHILCAVNIYTYLSYQTRCVKCPLHVLTSPRREFLVLVAIILVPTASRSAPVAIILVPRLLGVLQARVSPVLVVGNGGGQRPPAPAPPSGHPPNGASSSSKETGASTSSNQESVRFLGTPRVRPVSLLEAPIFCVTDLSCDTLIVQCRH